MTSQYLLLLVVLCLLLLPVHSWWGRPPPKTHYCGQQIDDRVIHHCHPKWGIPSCPGACPGKKKRDVAMKDTDAMAFIQAVHSRRKREAVAGLYEECCREGCSEEEIYEHC